MATIAHLVQCYTVSASTIRKCWLLEDVGISVEEGHDFGSCLDSYQGPTHCVYIRFIRKKTSVDRPLLEYMSKSLIQDNNYAIHMS